MTPGTGVVRNNFYPAGSMTYGLANYYAKGGGARKVLGAHLRACNLVFEDEFIVDFEENADTLSSWKVYGEQVYGDNGYGGKEFISEASYQVSGVTHASLMKKEEPGRTKIMWHGGAEIFTSRIYGGNDAAIVGAYIATSNGPKVLLLDPVSVLPKIPELEPIHEYYGSLTLDGNNFSATWYPQSTNSAIYVVDGANLPFKVGPIMFCLETDAFGSNIKGVVTVCTEDFSSFTVRFINAVPNPNPGGDAESDADTGV